MGDTVGFGSIEGRLCGELIAAIAGPRSTREQYTNGGSYFRNFGAAAAKLGVASYDTWFIRYFHDPSDMPDILAARPISAEDLETMISSFLGVVCTCSGNDGQCLSDERDWFDAPSSYSMSLRWLARLGYAEHEGTKFRWTDRISSAMQKAYLWSEDGQSWAALNREREALEAFHAWQTMPDTSKAALSSGRLALLDLVKLLALGWTGEKWREFRMDDPFTLSGQVTLAKNILQLVE